MAPRPTTVAARSFAAVVTAGIVVAMASCSSEPQPPMASSVTSSAPPANVYNAARTAGVSRTLAELTRATMAGDNRALDAIIDQSATPEFRRTLHVAAANLSTRTASRERVETVTVPATESPADLSPAATDAPGSATPTDSTSRSATTPETTGTETTGTESTGRQPSSASSGVPASEEVVSLSRGTGLRLVRFDYAVAPTEEAETLVPAEIQQRLDAAGSSDSWVVPVELHYALGGPRLPGVNEPEIVVNSQLIMARYYETWRIVGDASLLDSSPRSAQLWDLPGLAASDVATAGGSSVIVSYPGTSRTVDRVRGLLPGSVDAVSAFWGPGWARRAVVVPTATDGEFASLATGSAIDVSGAAAATVFDRIDTTTRTALGQRIVLTPGAGNLQTPALAVVLRHELTHIAVRGITSPGAPLWITEGVPEYVGRRGTYVRFADAAPELADSVRSGRVPSDLPADRDFAVDSATARIAYQTGWSVAAYVADRYGSDKLKKLYLGVAATDDPRRSDAAISAALGVDRTQLVQGWQRWLREQVR